MTKTVRLSNIELLRIFAIFFVLLFHSNFHTLGIPSIYNVADNPFRYLCAFSVQGLTVICVNVFVLISGWFGIRPSLKGALKFVYQILFFLVGSYLLAIAFDQEKLSIGGIAHCFLLDDYAWFVKSYLLLYILAPILNSYIESRSQSDVRKLILAFYIFQTIYGWLSDGAYFFRYGSSVVSFIGLYILARYINLYKPKFSTQDRKKDILLFTMIIFLESLFLVVICSCSKLDGIYHSIVGHMYSYSSPVVILQSVAILLYFSKLSFSCNTINFIAASSFSSLFVHGNPYIFPYQESVISIYANNHYFIALIKVTILCGLAFVIAILLDQIRKITWNLMNHER